MSTYKTAEEVEQEHLSVMGPELGPVYHRLFNECAWLQITWQQYVELFGSRSDRIDLLNQAAALFFRIVQDNFWDDTLLQLSRITDPPESAGKANLTIQRLPPLISYRNAQAEVQGLVDAAITSTSFARDWRNRRIAHRDLALALKQGAQPLEAASRKQVKDAVADVCAVIKRVNLIYFNSELALDLVPSEPNGAVSLLYVIRDGVDADAARRDRLRSGKPHPEDLEPPRAV